MAVVLLAAGGAAADPYPQLAVDRPQLYAPGMTAADVGVDARTYRYGYSSSTRLGDYVYPDLVVTHAFEGFELSGRFAGDVVGPFADVGGGGYLGPGVLWVSAGFVIPNNDSGLDGELMQVVDYHVKSVVVPHVLSIDGGAALNLYEVSQTGGQSLDPMNLGVSGGATLQLVPEFSFHVDAAVYVPVADTTYSHTSLFVGGEARYVIDRFDVYAWAHANDVQRAPLPSVGAGVIARFGP
jgi:hypothetical protein